MIKIKALLLNVGETGAGYVTEDAAKSMVERFKKRKEKMIIKFGKSPLVVGVVEDVEYNEKDKAVYGSLLLNLNIDTDGKILQKLDTPSGPRVLDCELKGVSISPKVLNKPTEQK